MSTLTKATRPPTQRTGATTVDGADLHVGDTILDPVDGHTVHHITALNEYRGRFCGDHARRAHDGTGWGATICDHHRYQRVAA